MFSGTTVCDERDPVAEGAHRQPRYPADPCASEIGDLHVEWRRDRRAVPDGARLVRTDQPLGAIAVYLCEPESDDGAVENTLIAAPKLGEEFPIWRTVG